jgi:hypothetical protein
MQYTVLLRPQLPENTVKRDAKIEDHADETDQKQRQDEFRYAHMPGALNAVYNGRAADI